ncbi:uncharacterized protein LOC114351600 [Ostrinia furnacalis]|uniref:uncharacterized protein LOC114351600 n=1 Tax=Ostrinia furnacalis TaxID=93504 RepID=UPI001039A605|nr:uncharacterized protein LOC114351600 [Ostrinia furnacalis]
MWPSGEWADEDAPPDTPDGPDAPDGCPGPQFTLSQCMLRRLRARCSLSVLALEYCNIDCNTTSINNFPPTLKWLSLRGSRCYNLPVDKSFLFNVQDLLPEIEHLDLSECTWMEPSSLLPLSKAPRLKRLLLRECPRLAEFVAYASLAARYGFRTLEVLDLRGSPVADSEVSALGWLPALQELYIAPAREAPAPDHRHYSGEPLPAFRELEPWEVDVFGPARHRCRPLVSALGWLPALQELYIAPAREAPAPDHRHYSGEPLPAFRELEPWEVDVFGPARHRCRPLVSALGWLPALQELYIAPAREAPAPDHRHYSGEPLPAFRELEPWEVDGHLVASSVAAQVFGPARHRCRPLVSALGWLPALQELYIAPAREAPAPDHRHYSGEPLPAFRELEPWEVDEPEYFKIQAETTENNDQNLCLHGVDYNLCTEGTTRRTSGLKRPAEQSTSTDEPQPAMSSVKVIEVSLRNPGESRTISSSVHVIPPFRPRQSLIDPLDLASPAKKKKTEEDDEEESTNKGSRDVSTNTPWVIDYNTCQIVGKRTFKEFEAYPSGSGSSDQPGPSKKKKLDPEEKPGCSKDACKSKPVKSCPQPGSSKDACPKKDSKKKSSSPKDGSGSSKDGPGSSKDGPGSSKEGSGSSKDGETKTRPFNKSITSRNIIFAQPGRSNDEAGPSNKKDSDSEGSLNTANRVVYYAPQNENAPNDSTTNEPNQQQEEEANSEFRNTQAEPGPSRRMVFILPPENHCCVRNRPNPFPNMPGPSTHRRFVVSREPAENSEEEESENVPEDLSADRKSQDPNPNDVAGPSRDPDRPDKNNQDCHKPTEHSSGCKCKNSHKYEYVRFRQNMDPVIVRRDPADVEREEREREHAFENREVRPRAHVLYVNVGQQLHSVYRLSIHTEPPIYYTFGGNRHIALRPNVGNLFYPSYTPHLDAASLVTDFAVRRFGRAEIEDINVVHIGPRVDGGEVGARPDRSNLRILSITGFRNITDRSLAHLVSSAPHLRLIDFSRTRVSSQGVENFRCLRPDCQVIYSEFTENGE